MGVTIDEADGLGPPPEADVLPAEQLRALARFRSSVEHELRSPLNAICLNLELLSAEVAELGSEASSALADTLAALRQGVARMTGNVESVLRAALPSSDRRAEAVDLTQVVAGVATLCRLEARLARVRCDIDLPSRAIVAEVRKDALQQTLLLMANEALQRVRSGGTISVSLDADGESAAIRFAAEPWQPATDGTRGLERALAQAAETLGGELHRGQGESSGKVELRLATGARNGR